ncbi:MULTISPECIES: type-F conjugative transfer system secretin TraK [Sphingomonas]|jgi:conjugal transfer pilus assembly protein TraK|uniref:type-F conjugative transfer system secretin TraK n=1 Tax=Sphingomonas TaxID=13687 RepID=UPI0028ECDF80|nr:type-F conjugative transfer system secretin TraK [uncultured Sphingomonas sp.]
MTSYLAFGSAALGTVLASRSFCHLSRLAGGALIGASVLLFATPAFADQNLQVSDGAAVQCNASARDLTRISLVQDEFASVSKINTGNPSDDFSVVNEPVRGDIYLSVPDGYSRPVLSFFATSKRGYVYKFACRIAGNEAAQVFLSNPAIEKAEAADEAPMGRAAASTTSPQEGAIQLIQAMYANKVGDGYEMKQRAIRPVHVGDLKVQMIAEYRGSDLTGHVLRIENTGTTETVLTDDMVAPRGALAVSIADPKLAVGKVTTAYLVSRSGK